MEEACDMFHPDYGWIRINNVTTEQGLKFFKDQRERYGARKENQSDKEGFELCGGSLISKRNFN